MRRGGVLFCFIGFIKVIKCDLLAGVECERSEDGYLVPDPYQCDRFAECTPHGDLKIQLCTDGHALDLSTGVCDLYSKVDCTGREKLQKPTGLGLCPRQNGNFPVPVEISCSEYVDCREGQAFMQNCGHGAVFDELLGCVHPDETSRIGCRAEDVFGFKCPDFGDSRRFGDHERLAHPEDCALFYACLNTGQPRLLGCEKPKVFDPADGLCKKQALVPGCEHRYPPEAEKDNFDVESERKRIADEIKAELEAKFGLRKGSLTAADGPAPQKQEETPPSSPPKETDDYLGVDGFAGLRRSRPRSQVPRREEAPVQEAARQAGRRSEQPAAQVIQVSEPPAAVNPANIRRNSLFARPRARI